MRGSLAKKMRRVTKFVPSVEREYKPVKSMAKILKMKQVDDEGNVKDILNVMPTYVLKYRTDRDIYQKLKGRPRDLNRRFGE